MFVILGYLITFGCIFGVFIAHGGNIKVVLEALPFEMITIGGAAAGAFCGSRSADMARAPGLGGGVVQAAPIERSARLQMRAVAGTGLWSVHSRQSERTQSGRVLAASFSQLPTESCT